MRLDRQRARTSGGELAYFDAGSGKPVVFLHGFPTSAHLWRDLAPLTSTVGRAIAPDLLGYGDSEKPETVPLDIGAQAAYVRELLRELDVETFAAVGHDLGGGVAQLLALDGGVEALVLIDSVAPGSGASAWEPLLDGDEAADAEFAQKVVGGAFERGMGHRERLADEDLEEYVRPWRADPRALLRAAQALEGDVGVDATARLSQLGIPTFVLWGEDDPYRPAAEAERLGDALAGSTVALLPGCSHYVLDDAPETAAPLVFEYLRTMYLGAPRHAPVRTQPVDLGVAFERPPEEPWELPDE